MAANKKPMSTADAGRLGGSVSGVKKGFAALSPAKRAAIAKKAVAARKRKAAELKRLAAKAASLK